MDIKQIATSITNKVTNTAIKTQKYLLNDPIQDSAEFRRAKMGEAVDEIAAIKDENGNRVFSNDEMDKFKLAYLAGKIEVEPIKRFALKTELKMEDYTKLTSFHKDAKDPELYNKLDKKFDELKSKNINVLGFEQNKFLPTEQFSLRQFNNNSDARGINYVSYNSNTMKPVAKKTICMVDLKSENPKFKTNIKNLKDNSEHTSIMDENGYTLETTVIKKDKSGNVIRTEKMTPSNVKGIMDVEYQYPDGRKEIATKGSVDKKTGITTVKKDLKSADGTRTEYLYEDDPQGNRLVDCKITDKNGKVLMKNSQTFEVISENKFRSSNNNDTYDIIVNEKDLVVKDVRRELEAKIDFKKQFKGEKEELLNLLKKVPGNELFDTVDSISKLNGLPKDEVLKSGYMPYNKNVMIGDDLFVFLHELGHAKDSAIREKGLLTEDKKLFTDNKTIKKLWQEERARFNENATDIERDIISYFIKAKGHYQGEFGGLGELIAETNALTSSIPTETSERIGARTQLAQQHFPKTIAAIKDAMNYKNDLYAIEFYGT